MTTSKLGWGRLLILLAAGCGADDGDPATTTSASTTASTGTTATATGTSTSATDATETTTDGTPGTETGQAPSTGSSDGSGSTGAVAMDTWENWALPSFFEVYCNECHPGQSTRDFSVYDEVVENQVHIRCGVAPEALPDCDDHIEPGHLPIGDGPFPSDEDRLRLVDWIDAGMPTD